MPTLQPNSGLIKVMKSLNTKLLMDQQSLQMKTEIFLMLEILLNGKLEKFKMHI